MELEALRTVSLVAQHGSFAAAARALGLDPSSVSRTVAGVEASLGLRLFQRTTRSLAVTEEGEMYIERIRPLLEELNHAREAATLSRREARGTLRLTASVAFAQECIVPHLGEFTARHPQLTLELLPSDANLDIQAEGIDLAIRLAVSPSGSLIASRLASTRYRVCASPAWVTAHGAPGLPQELEALDCLRFALPEFRTRWRFRQGDAVEEVPVSGRLVISNALALRDAARDGLGPVLLADWLIRRDLAEGRLIDLFPDHACTATEFDTAAWALFPTRRYLPRKTRVMIDFLRAKLKAEGGDPR